MPAAERLHGIPVAFEESNESDGIWSISLEREDRVYIYAIPQGKILWKTSGSDKYENLLSCPLKL
jgi:hypothetical protein